MQKIGWIGPRPARAVVQVLAAHDLVVGGPDDPAPLVIATARARVPSPPPPGRGPWIWTCAMPIGDDLAIAAARAGAHDAIPLADPLQLAATLAELAAPAPTIEPGELVAKSSASRRVIEELARAAATSTPVLLTGETGTGKDLAARLLHGASTRAKKRFVAINCAAVPDELIESELFGHVKGAFSGAVADYDGQLAAAAGGTVFLDEIDDTPPTLQVKLLRVLEDRMVTRLGENEWRRVDFRIVAATNRDLPALVEAGVFAGDLYQRLAILEISLPPLRERLEDLPALIERFILRFHAEEKAPREVRGASSAALRALAAYPWPGNVRELRNVVYQAIVGKRAGDEILPSDLPRRILDPRAAAPPGIDTAALARRIDAGTMNLRGLLEEIERAALLAALERAGGSPAKAARLLGEVGRGRARDPGATVRAMMRRLGVT